MTITEARKVLGILSKNIPDNELIREIEIASLLKDIFFSIYLRGKKDNKVVDNLYSFKNDVQSQ